MSDTEQAPAAPRRVVVAEDESLIRLDIVEILRDNGFDVVGEAGDGETAVALATDMLPLCSGSDTGGSLRIPAAKCGVVGFRPSPGVVPVERRPFGGDLSRARWHADPVAA